MYISDWDRRLDRYAQYWARQNHDRPLLNLTAPRDRTFPARLPYPGTLKERWWDCEYIAKQARADLGATYFAAESLPILNPNLGPDVSAAFVGAELEYGEDTSWAHPFVESWEGLHVAFDEENPYWRRLVEMTEYFLQDSNRDYLVGVTDLHGGMDTLVAMRGPENVCMDLYDCPEEILRMLDELLPVFRETLRRSHELIARSQRGSVNWMGIYKEDPWYVSSSDFIYLVSPEQFDEFCVEGIRREAEIIGPNIYHLDGVGSARHLDKLLELPEIDGIQWVYGAGQPTAAHWIDLLRRVQDAGKLIEVECTQSDILPLLQSGLHPEGVRYTLRVNSPEEADHIVKLAEEAYRKPGIAL